MKTKQQWENSHKKLLNTEFWKSPLIIIEDKSGFHI